MVKELVLALLVVYIIGLWVTYYAYLRNMSLNDISKKFANTKPNRITTPPTARKRLPDKSHIEAKRLMAQVAATKPVVRGPVRDEAGVRASKAFANVPLLRDATIEETDTEREAAFRKLGGNMPHKSQLELSKTKFEDDIVDPRIENQKTVLQGLKSVAPRQITMAGHTLEAPIPKDLSRMPMPEITSPLTVERRFDPSRKVHVAIKSSKEPRIILSHYYASQDNKFTLRSM